MAWLFASALTLLTAASSTLAQPAPVAPTLPAGITAGPSLEGISEYRLQNGLKALLFPDASKELTLVNITYLVGSKEENYGETGMAHLLEHMIFKGTPKHPDMLKEFTARGMRWNGTTSLERTNYFEAFTSSPDNLRFAIELEADRMVNSFIAKKDLDSEMTVVRNEFERRDSQPGVIFQRLNAAAFTSHNYGKPAIGTLSDIENVNIERLQDFYKRHYQPDNAVLLIAGKFDPTQALGIVAEAFAPIAKPDRVLPTLYTVEPTQDGEREVTVRRVGDVKLVVVGYKVPSKLHPDSAALSLLAQVLVSNPSGPLYREFVESKRAVQIFPFSTGSNDVSLAGVGLVADKNADVSALERELLDRMEGRTAMPITQEASDRARREIAVGFEKAMESPIGVAMALSEVVSLGDWRVLFAQRDAVQAVTLADLERVKAKYFKPANRTLARYLPDDTPDRVEVAAAPPVSSLLAAYKPRATVDGGESFAATPEMLESRTVRNLADPTFQYAQLKKQNRGNAVTVKINLRWGELRAQLKQPALNFVAPMISEGESPEKKQARTDAMTQLRTRFSLSGGMQSATLTINSDRDHILDAIKLLLPQVRSAKLSPDAFARFKKRLLTQIESGAREPQTVINNLAIPYKNKAFGLSPGDPEYRRTYAEQIAQLESITYDDVLKAFAGSWGANDVHVSIVGTAPTGIADEVRNQLNGWESKAGPYVRYVSKYQPLPGTTLTAEAPDKTNALIDVDQYLPLTRKNPDAAALELAVSIFGGSALDNRLAARIRKKDGLSYEIGASVSIPDYGDNAYFGVQGTYAPINRDRVIKALREETDSALKDGFTTDELERNRANAMQARQQSRSSDDSVANALLMQMDLNETFADSASRDAQLKAVTLQQVNDAFRKYVKPEAWLIGLAGDFAKAAATTK
ncbi:MAG: insulinase family protein [Casimicrobium sp.]